MSMHSILIVSPIPVTSDIIAGFLNLPFTYPHPDSLVIGDLSAIGIDQIRELKRFFHQAPHSALVKVAYIPKAHLLTPAAQNALLKTLEEPPAYARIVLQTDKPDALLATIHSRCVRIDHWESLPPAATLHLQSILPLNFAARFEYFAPFAKDRGSAKQCLLEIIAELQQQILKEPTLTDAARLRTALTVYRQLEANVTPTLALEHLCLEL